VTSSKPFEVVVASLEEAIGHPDMLEFFKATNGARTIYLYTWMRRNRGLLKPSGAFFDTNSRRITPSVCSDLFPTGTGIRACDHFVFLLRVGRRKRSAVM
jgi:hypothetical protein